MVMQSNYSSFGTHIETKRWADYDDDDFLPITKCVPTFTGLGFPLESNTGLPFLSF